MKITTANNTIVKNPVDGAEGRIVHGEGLTVASWQFTAGASLPAHSHPHEQITWVVSGTIQLTADGTKYTLNAGDSAVIPGNVVHEATAVSDASLIDAFHPVREDLQ